MNIFFCQSNTWPAIVSYKLITKPSAWQSDRIALLLSQLDKKSLNCVGYVTWLNFKNLHVYLAAKTFQTCKRSKSYFHYVIMIDKSHLRWYEVLINKPTGKCSFAVKETGLKVLLCCLSCRRIRQTRVSSTCSSTVS